MRNLITEPSSSRKPSPCWTPTTSTRLPRAFLSRNTSHIPKRSRLCWKGNLRSRADESCACRSEIQVETGLAPSPSTRQETRQAPSLHQQLVRSPRNPVLHQL